MLKVLFIEDQPVTIEPVLNLLRREQPDIQAIVLDFADAEGRIASDHPDIVVLDLVIDGSSPEPRVGGLKTHSFIWDKHFCPIIIYSGFPDIYEDNVPEHPFVKCIKKGTGSPLLVLEALVELRQHVEALKEAEDYIRQSFSVAMREVAPYAVETFTDAAQCRDSIKRSGRRRLAALMDGFTDDPSELASWEQYLSPPVSPDVKLGDVLRKTDGECDNPSSFRLVLTPSCDLVASNGRTPKVANVLAACCTSIEDALDRIQMKPSQKTLANEKGVVDFGDRLKKDVLSQGYYQAIVPFPCLKGRIPSMAANLRKLEFIPISDIGESDKSFLRIASIDSPFRELVSWAYMHTACRPGLPDRDLNSWQDEIIAILKITGVNG
jgi:CheY-like chemotaxis protein